MLSVSKSDVKSSKASLSLSLPLPKRSTTAVILNSHPTVFYQTLIRNSVGLVDVFADNFVPRQFCNYTFFHPLPPDKNLDMKLSLEIARKQNFVACRLISFVTGG